jgi:Cu2+-exporting ATPase
MGHGGHHGGASMADMARDMRNRFIVAAVLSVPLVLWSPIGRLGAAIGAGTDVAIETADVVLMRSDPMDVPIALRVGRGTVRKMRQNLSWAVGYNAVALPIAAGVFASSLGLVLRPEIAGLSMSGSSLLIAFNALLLKRLRLPQPPTA